MYSALSTVRELLASGQNIWLLAWVVKSLMRFVDILLDWLQTEPWNDTDTSPQPGDKPSVTASPEPKTPIGHSDGHHQD